MTHNAQRLQQHLLLSIARLISAAVSVTRHFTLSGSPLLLFFLFGVALARGFDVLTLASSRSFLTASLCFFSLNLDQDPKFIEYLPVIIADTYLLPQPHCLNLSTQLQLAQGYNLICTKSIALPCYQTLKQCLPSVSPSPTHRIHLTCHLCHRQNPPRSW